MKNICPGKFTVYFYRAVFGNSGGKLQASYHVIVLHVDTLDYVRRSVEENVVSNGHVFQINSRGPLQSLNKQRGN